MVCAWYTRNSSKQRRKCRKHDGCNACKHTWPNRLKKGKTSSAASFSFPCCSNSLSIQTETRLPPAGKHEPFTGSFDLFARVCYNNTDFGPVTSRPETLNLASASCNTTRPPLWFWLCMHTENPKQQQTRHATMTWIWSALTIECKDCAISHSSKEVLTASVCSSKRPKILRNKSSL